MTKEEREERKRRFQDLIRFQSIEGALPDPSLELARLCGIVFTFADLHPDNQENNDEAN